MIETISAVDRDEPPSGHRFFFSLAAEAVGNLNFTLRDNKGCLALSSHTRLPYNTSDQRALLEDYLIIGTGH